MDYEYNGDYNNNNNEEFNYNENNFNEMNYEYNNNYNNNNIKENSNYQNEYDSNFENKVIPSKENKNMISKINQIFNLLNLNDNISLYSHKSDQEKEKIRTNNIINLLLFIFSGFKIKLKENASMNNIFNNQTELDNNLKKLNLILKYLNSKFLIKNNISSEEYSLLTIYYIDYFDLFKNLLDYLKNKQNESLFSWNNLYLSINDTDTNSFNAQNDFNHRDNLKRMESNQSNSVLESYNKLHFIISNIKKQLDTLINQIFKLNELKINQSLGRYKLEEIILISDDKVYEDYKQSILFSNNNIFINKYLEKIIDAIKKYSDLYDLLVKNSKNNEYSNEIINSSHNPFAEEKSESNKVNKTKLNFIQKLIGLKYNLNNFDLNEFKNFFNDL